MGRSRATKTEGARTHVLLTADCQPSSAADRTPSLCPERQGPYSCRRRGLEHARIVGGSTPMTGDPAPFDPALERAVDHARRWLGSVAERPVGPQASADEVRALFGGPLSEEGEEASRVVDELARGEPGLMAIGSGRFFGWVMGGTLPAALGADWLTSAWDQNAGLRYATPAVAAIEE